MADWGRGGEEGTDAEGIAKKLLVRTVGGRSLTGPNSAAVLSNKIAVCSHTDCLPDNLEKQIRSINMDVKEARMSLNSECHGTFFFSSSRYFETFSFLLLHFPLFPPGKREK